MTVPEIVGIVASAFTVAGLVQAWGNRSMNRNIDAKIAVPLARLEEKQANQILSLTEHKAASSEANKSQLHVMEGIRTDFGALKERVAVVEDRTARMMGSGPWGAPLKERGHNE